MIDCFWPFVILESLKQTNKVTEMEIQNKLLRTGETVVMTKDRAPGFEFVEFGLLDAPPHMPSGSVVCIDNILGDDFVVMPDVFVRGW